MKVDISETTLILPSDPPFNNPHTLRLSPLDTDPNNNVDFRYLRVYTSSSPTTTSTPFHVFSTALSSALVHYYPLAGTLRQHELFCTENQGIPIINATSDCTLESLNFLDDPDQSQEQFIQDLVPKLELTNGSITHPCVLQFTMFRCGGFTLGTSIHHSLADGLGATQFFNAVAELARGSDQIKVDPVWRRDELLGPREVCGDVSVIEEALRLEKGFVSYSQEVGKVVRECFPVTDECLDELKRKLFDECGSKFTTFEALGAFIWRAKVRAINVGGEKEVKMVYSTNIRKQIKPPLPNGYWGNGIVPIYITQISKNIQTLPLSSTAKLIQQSKSKITNEYVRSFLHFQAFHYGEGITAGDEVSGFSDWRHIGHATVDFGWGGPVTVLPLAKYLLGSVEPCFFLPHSSAPGLVDKKGFKVSVSIRESAMPAFRREMEKLLNFGV